MVILTNKDFKEVRSSDRVKNFLNKFFKVFEKILFGEIFLWFLFGNKS
jgi:hypothetical protein